MSSEKQSVVSTAPGGRPADIWRTNGGLYLGLTPQGRTNPLRPLEGKEMDPTMPYDAPIRSTWTPDGKANLYCGEGHAGIWGPQGSGKSRKIVMPNLFKLRDWSNIIIDTKGELCAHTALWRSQQPGHKVYVIDPFGVMRENYPKLFAQHPQLFKSCGYNPFRTMRPGHPSFADDAKAMAMALISADESRDPYWPQAAQALVKGLSMALRVDRPGKSDSLQALRTALGLPPKELAEFAAILATELGERYPAIAANLGEFTSYTPEDREIGGVRRNAKTQTDWLDSPLIQRDLAKNTDIDFASFKQTPQTCYLILPPGELENHGVWLRLMITAALRPMLRSVEKAAVPVLFILDEIAALGPMPFLVKNIAQLRGYGVKLLTIWQDLDQMRRIYPKAWGTFMSTAEAKVTFTNNEPDILDYFSRMSGERLYVHKSPSWSKNESYSRSNSTNEGYLPPGSGTTISSRMWGPSGAGLSESWSENTTSSIGEQRLSERVVKPYEIAALDADEALIFSRRGKISRAICPQPDILPGVGDAIRAARLQIEGPAKPKRQRSRPRGRPRPAGVSPPLSGELSS